MKRFTLSKLTCLIAMLLSLVLMTAQVASAAPLKEETWKIVPSPNGSLHNSILFGVATISKQNAWAVGNTYNQDNIDNTPLIEHWNGSQWSIVKSPNPGVTQTIEGDLTVVSKKNIWAVGFYDTGSGSINTLVLHWNGSRWRVVPSPNPGTDNELNKVVAVSANDIWAMGIYFTGSGTPGKTLIEHCC